MITINTREDVEVFIKDQIAKCNQQFGSDVPLDASVIWFLKGTHGGKALRKGKQYTIQLNVQLWHQDRRHMMNTITHEIAHLIIFSLKSQGKSNDPGHGQDWRIVHRFMGGNGERCHAMKLEGARKQKYHKYRTHSGFELLLSAQKHNKIQRGYCFKTKKTGETFGAKHYVGVA